MLFSFDENKNLTDVDDSDKAKNYFCPICSAPLKIIDGKNHLKYFLHDEHKACFDSFEHSYLNSNWSISWKRSFPKENREVILKYSDDIHKADILIDRTVVIFDDISLNNKRFYETNTFFNNLGLKVVWLIDLRDELSYKNLTYKACGKFLSFKWSKPMNAFNSFIESFTNVDLFFQISSIENYSIVRVLKDQNSSFKGFFTTDFLSNQDFKNYVGFKDKKCSLPCTKNTEDIEGFNCFKEKYNLHFNPQQERAVQAIDGANLLLAVPGSGKTTVLINRIAYMILEKHIDPKSILALTYNVSACNDMKQRFSKLFGNDIKEAPEFRTLNSISLQIYRTYCRMNNFKERELFEEKERTFVIRKIYIEISGNKAVSETDIKFLSSHFTYIKNMGLKDEDIIEFNKEMPKFDKMYLEYRKYLKSNYKMDFDDQLVLAHSILTSFPNILKMYRDRFKYICVDEAQDTSKIQHQIISLLAQGNNIFMVGDEDQSIYGFRAAYPQALLNFRFDYDNPYIQKMEFNYRSVCEITEKASRFISKNTDRFDKKIIPVRQESGEFKKITVSNRLRQYEYLLAAAKERTDKTAFLYRDNASSIILIDKFLRDGVPFIHRTADINFFETKTVLDILAYLKLILNPYDADSFERVCNKGILFIKNNVKYPVLDRMRRNRLIFFEAIDKCSKLIDPSTQSYLLKGIATLRGFNKSSAPKDLISLIRSSGYDQYMSKQKISKNNVDVLEILASKEMTIEDFLDRIDYLQSSIKEGFYSKDNPVILSTIHSSKGLEYDTVYMVDVFDGVFPSSPPSLNGKMTDEDLEERRIFYVGITRAKNNLYLMDLESNQTSFIDELFPNTANKIRKNYSPSSAVDYAHMTTKQLNERRLQRQNQKIVDARCFDEVKHKFTNGVKVVKDSMGRDWVKCDCCHKIKLSQYFYDYSDYSYIECKKCADKK